MPCGTRVRGKATSSWTLFCAFRHVSRVSRAMAYVTYCGRPKHTRSPFDAVVCQSVNGFGMVFFFISLFLPPSCFPLPIPMLLSAVMPIWFNGSSSIDQQQTRAFPRHWSNAGVPAAVASVESFARPSQHYNTVGRVPASWSESPVGTCHWQAVSNWLNRKMFELNSVCTGDLAGEKRGTGRGWVWCILSAVSFVLLLLLLLLSMIGFTWFDRSDGMKWIENHPSRTPTNACQLFGRID